ncbi:hypothetical protein GCM10023350_52020 [Nocardioides endophyticus]|uniref:Uncharacterized protein n=1 Tax=Nocardioides endophyticus TaxID=1353775 RepID=A0ABP8ZLJ2_9ACTN
MAPSLVIGSTPGHRNQVIGTRVTAEGSVSAWIDPVSDRKDAIRLVRAQLADDRLGYLTSPEVIAMGDRLDQFEHVDVTGSIEVQTSDDWPSGLTSASDATGAHRQIRALVRRRYGAPR